MSHSAPWERQSPSCSIHCEQRHSLRMAARQCSTDWTPWKRYSIPCSGSWKQTTSAWRTESKSSPKHLPGSRLAEQKISLLEERIRLDMARRFGHSSKEGTLTRKAAWRSLVDVSSQSAAEQVAELRSENDSPQVPVRVISV